MRIQPSFDTAQAPGPSTRYRAGTFRVVAVALVAVAGIVALAACRSNTGAYQPFNQADCLRSIDLVDQSGREVNLSSLKGKPVLIDFIYTTCPGECLLLTQKMARVAARMGPRAGADFTMVSVTVDPEHDGPAQLAAYAKGQGIDDQRWLFLTGPPPSIDRVLKDFQLRRQRAADGSVQHIDGVFLLGPDGHERREYDGQVAKASAMVSDLENLLSQTKSTGTASAGQ